MSSIPLPPSGPPSTDERPAGGPATPLPPLSTLRLAVARLERTWPALRQDPDADRGRSAAASARLRERRRRQAARAREAARVALYREVSAYTLALRDAGETALRAVATVRCAVGDAASALAAEAREAVVREAGICSLATYFRL
ncbi:MAG: hypothetical protein JO180_02325 [Gemmatirosa sp.]|nr:hypothetical protein [Gemmatirosa sp.]